MEEIKQIKGRHESEVSWQRRKKFLTVYQSKFPKERLTALSYCYANVLLYGCKYSDKLMEDLYEMACDMANYPWDEPVNKMSMKNKIFYEPVVRSVQNSVKKNRKRRSTSMKDLLKAFKDLNLNNKTADSQESTNANTILHNSPSENIQASFDNSIYQEYICPVLDLQNKSNVVYSKLISKDSDHTNKMKKFNPISAATKTFNRNLLCDTFMPDLNLTSQASTSKSVKPKTTNITRNPDGIHVTNKLNFIGSDNLHITESNTNKKSHSQVETENVVNANQIEMKDEQTSHCSIKLHPKIQIAKKSKRREIQQIKLKQRSLNGSKTCVLGKKEFCGFNSSQPNIGKVSRKKENTILAKPYKTYYVFNKNQPCANGSDNLHDEGKLGSDCCKSKANQKYENLKACTKINQKSNDKPRTKTAEESLIHLNTDGAVVAEKRHKTTPTNKIEPDNLHNQDKLKSFITSDCNANAKHIYERLKIKVLEERLKHLNTNNSAVMQKTDKITCADEVETDNLHSENKLKSCNIFYSSIKAEQRSENHKTCTKIDQKSNETPTFDVSEESLKHFNTDYYSAVAEKRHKITHTGQVKTGIDNLPKTDINNNEPRVIKHKNGKSELKPSTKQRKTAKAIVNKQSQHNNNKVFNQRMSPRLPSPIFEENYNFRSGYSPDIHRDYARRTGYYGPYKKLDSPNNNESWFGQGYTFPLYDQYLQYGRNYVPPCSLGNRRRGRSGYPVQLPRDNTE